MSDIIIKVQMVYSIHLLIRNKKTLGNHFPRVSNCRQNLRLSVEDFAVLFYDDTRNRKSKKAIGLAIKILMYSTVFV